jgi:hypothetical protein
VNGADGKFGSWPRIGTSRFRGRATKPAELIGTRSADRIRASGHACRVNRPDTCLHPTELHQHQNSPCAAGAVHTCPLTAVASPRGQRRGRAASGRPQVSLRKDCMSPCYAEPQGAHLRSPIGLFEEPQNPEHGPGDAIAFHQLNLISGDRRAQQKLREVSDGMPENKGKWQLAQMRL